MNKLLTAILDDDRAAVAALLKTNRELSTRLISSPILYTAKILHWIYAGDTPLHLAAAGYRVEIVRLLLSAGADVNAGHNHRAGTPLHYAADGCVGGLCFDPKRQVETLRELIDQGADVQAQDKNGATALHRAVRTRCASAVRFLLEAGADPSTPNKPGSTPFHLAVQNTGRGGSGAAAAIDAQRQIIKEFLARGLSPDLKSSRGKTVRESARSDWIRELLAAAPEGISG